MALVEDNKLKSTKLKKTPRILANPKFNKMMNNSKFKNLLWIPTPKIGQTKKITAANMNNIRLLK